MSVARGPTIVGVRHHSPACARIVRATIRRERPGIVLVEGPCDMNARLGELALGHALPIAIYTYRSAPEPPVEPAAVDEAELEVEPTGERAPPARSRGSWCPLCAYSPEWVALEEGRAAGARVLFMDVPAWHECFDGVENRYSDRHQRASDRIADVCARLGFEDLDALWDHLFEQPQDDDALASKLTRYFEALRADEPAGPRDAPREEMMARAVAWAMGQTERVLVVCGGFHAPALARAWRAAEPAEPIAAPPDGVRTGSYLVPYSFHRLDAFTGYQSGMPSPLWYQRVWDDGPERAPEEMLFEAIAHLRKKQQRVSPADAIAASTLAHGLMAMRDHRALARTDVLDGLAGALVKDSVDAPLPWTRRGTLLPRTDPMLIELVAAFSGERYGRLAEGTPAPPLVIDAHQALADLGVQLGRVPQLLKPDLTTEAGLRRSRVMHRLRVLEIPGFALKRSIRTRRGATDLSEHWSVVHAIETDAALIEAAIWGATLEDAATAKLERRAVEARDVAALADVLVDATHAGIAGVTSRLIGEIAAVVGREPSLAVLGGALARMHGLWDHDALLGAAHSPDLGRVIALAFQRGMWLFEGIQGASAAYEEDLVRAAVALRDVVRHGGRLGADPRAAAAVCARKARDPDAPIALRGAAFGFLWSIRAEVDPDAHDAGDADEAVREVRAVAPERLGDFLAGLFALAREQARGAPAVLGAIDSALAVMDRQSFLTAVPSLRLAFHHYPPRERLAIAEAVLALHGADRSHARGLLKPAVAAEITRDGLALDAEVDARAARWGL